MRGIFSDQPPADVPPPAVQPSGGGWNGLSGRAKLGILGGVAIAAMAAIMWPSMGTHPQAAKAMPNEHVAAPISDYQAPPPVQDVAARVMGSPHVQPTRHVRPMPTEMALYAVKPPPAETAQPAPQAGTNASAAHAGSDGLPTTNHATMVHHPDFLIRAGDIIPCLPVDAQYSGKMSFTTCEVPTWFRSSNQHRGLLPPHTRLFGQIREGLQAGETRLGITYSLIQTPWFDMPVNSPAGDAMGRGGVEGDVQTFFWDRAGAVGLYALMDAGTGIGQDMAMQAMSRTSQYGGMSLNLTGPGESLASQELNSRINRPPVLTRDQALPVTVTVGQNLDFYDACTRAMRVDPMACPLQ